MNFESLKNKALSMGFEAIELYETKKENLSIEAFGLGIDACQKGTTYTYSIRAIFNKHVSAITLENENENEEWILNTLKDNASLIEKEDPCFIFGGSKEYPIVENVESDFNKFSLDDKKNILLKLNKMAFEKDELVVNTQSAYEENTTYIHIENSNGLNLKASYNVGYLYESAVLKCEEGMQDAYELKIFHHLGEVDLESVAASAVLKAKNMIGAKSLPSKKYRVVIQNEQFASLLNAFSSIFSAESVLKNMSFLKDKVGTKVFGDNVTIWDSPLNKEAIFQTAFDDEGVATYDKKIVENGVLTTYLHDLKTANMMNTESTGNASRQAGSIDVSPLNMFLEKGDVSFDDMLKVVDNGIYITSLQGLHAGLSTISGDFNLQAKGFKIEDGKIASPVTLIILSGNIKDVLNNIDLIADDFIFHNGVGSASIYIKEMMVSGE